MRPTRVEDTVNAIFNALPAPADLRASIESWRGLYADEVHWIAPRRGIEWCGRDVVIGKLLLEADCMKEPRYTQLRRSQCGPQVFDEYAVRFVLAGDGIEGVALSPGEHVELERLRILTVADGLVVVENCIETWSVLR